MVVCTFWMFELVKNVMLLFCFCFFVFCVCVTHFKDTPKIFRIIKKIQHFCGKQTGMYYNVKSHVTLCVKYNPSLGYALAM